MTETLAVSLIVAGLAFLCSGLIFLLPTQNTIIAKHREVEQSLNEIEHYLGRNPESADYKTRIDF